MSAYPFNMVKTPETQFKIMASFSQKVKYSKRLRYNSISCIRKPLKTQDTPF